MKLDMSAAHTVEIWRQALAEMPSESYDALRAAIGEVVELDYSNELEPQPVGIPYAPAGVDELGYYMQCPICQTRSYGPHGTVSSEDEITSGAAAKHYEHWTAEHAGA